MKNLFAFLILLIGVPTLFYGQAPQKMNYQAIVRNSQSNLIVNSQIGMRVSIVEGSSSGPDVYVETHSPITDANGLVTLQVGTGTSTLGEFASIDWSSGAYFIFTEIDPNGGDQYSIVGLTELLSVPFALYAESSGTGSSTGVDGVDGQDGSSAYDVWLEAGNTGTVEEFLASLVGGDGTDGVDGAAGQDGTSALEIWISQGNTGTEVDFINSLKGVDGTTILNGRGDPDEETGKNGDFYFDTRDDIFWGPKTESGWGSSVAIVGAPGATGARGIDGQSAFEVWQALEGNSEKTEAEFITAITGPQGDAGVQGTTGDQGPQGDQGVEGNQGLNGADGLSAYEVWQASTEIEDKTMEAYLASITGPQGAPGTPGTMGEPGSPGTPGQDGAPGQNGMSAFEVWQASTESEDKTMEAYLVSITGPQGAPGTPGTMGEPGSPGTPGQDGAPGTPGQDGAPGADATLPDGTDGDVLTYDGDNSEWTAQALPSGGGTLPEGANLGDLISYDGTSWVRHTGTWAAANNGGSQSFSNMQPYQVVNFIIALQGIYPSRSSSDPFLAEIIMFGGTFAPRGWAFCDGQLLSISSNEALFSLLGTTYGGDGRTSFGLPDLRGRVPMHAGNGPGLTPKSIGQKNGTENVTLTTTNLPSHSHTITFTAPTPPPPPIEEPQ